MFSCKLVECRQIMNAFSFVVINVTDVRKVVILGGARFGEAGQRRRGWWVSRGGGSNKRERRNIFCLGLSSMLIDQYGKRERECVWVCVCKKRGRG